MGKHIDDDNFLDKLMEDVIGGGESSEEEEVLSEPRDDSVDEVGEDVANGEDEVSVSEGGVARRAPGGLFARISGQEEEDGGQEEEGSEVIDEESSYSGAGEVSVISEEVIDEDSDSEGEFPEGVVEEVEVVSDEVNDHTIPGETIDEMLGSLEEEEDVDKVRHRASLDEDVEVPLEKPGMDEIIVTRDGKTLADMLPGMRKGNRKTQEVIDKIRNQDAVVDVNGKTFSDNRYTKHAEVIDEEVKRDRERVRLSNKFLQRNAEFTEQEKIIMRNLGLTNEQLANVMRSQELSRKQKKEILALGRYGSERVFKGRRYRTTVGDSAMLEFLVKFKFANTRILRWISNEPQNRTWRKLNRLRNSGLVESKTLIGVPDLWGATPAGVALSGYAYEPGLRPMPKMFSISSNMGVNYIAACLWFNSVNVLNLDDFPAKNRVIAVQDDGREHVKGEMLVSEYEIRSSLGKEINPQSTTMQTLGDRRLYDVISAHVRGEFKKWEDGGKVGESPEFSLGNEYMWVLYPTSELTLSYHVPDLVVKRERGENGEPKSIAVEMERFEKSNDRYDKIMLAYKLDEHLYDKVIWITPNSRVARALERAANSVGFDRYTIIPIITESGIYNKQDIWMI